MDRELQADAEHQQDDADFGELIGDALIGDEARRERTDNDAGKKVADQRRGLEPMRDDAEREGEHEADHNGGDERCMLRHGVTSRRDAVRQPLNPIPDTPAEIRT